jgi:hypothetical protein
MPSAPSTRRFLPPWRVTPIPGGWRVDDASGRPLAYVYGRDDQGASGTGLTVDEARRIATGISRLPERRPNRTVPGL